MTHFVSVGTGAARIQDLSMNPQKLAGQCAKLKCCLNFELDTYAEAAKKLPSKDINLLTMDAEYYYFKADILQRLVTYSTDRKAPVNLVTIPSSRAFEIIELNKQGIKPDQLEQEKEERARKPKEYIDLTDQDSLTRFDNSRKQKRRKKSNKVENQKASQEGGSQREPTREKQRQPPKSQQPNKQKQSGQNPIRQNRNGHRKNQQQDKNHAE